MFFFLTISLTMATVIDTVYRNRQTNGQAESRGSVSGPADQTFWMRFQRAKIQHTTSSAVTVIIIGFHAKRET